MRDSSWGFTNELNHYYTKLTWDSGLGLHEPDLRFCSGKRCATSPMFPILFSYLKVTSPVLGFRGR